MMTLTQPRLEHMASGIFCTLCLILTASAGEKMNILLFTADDMHAETTKALGGTLNVTPHLDRFANSGMVFENAGREALLFHDQFP